MRGSKFILILLFCLSWPVVGQIDNNQVIETDIFAYQPEENSDTHQSSFDAIVNTKQPSEVTPFGTLEDLSDIFPKYSVKDKRNDQSFARLIEKEKDVLQKKFFNGQDVSQNKITTQLELGRLETSTKSVRIECRDHSYVDGDRVRVFINGQVIRSNIVLKGGYYLLDLPLKEGFNRIDIQALNQGLSGPNTAEFNVYDGTGRLLSSKEWNIPTGYVATLVVLKN